MIDELAAAELLAGYRGAPAVDREQLGRVIASLGDLVVAGHVSEIEVNPLRVTSRGLVALDAVVLPAHHDQIGTHDD
jgi:acetyltransferase